MRTGPECGNWPVDIGISRSVAPMRASSRSPNDWTHHVLPRSTTVIAAIFSAVPGGASPHYLGRN